MVKTVCALNCVTIQDTLAVIKMATTDRYKMMDAFVMLMKMTEIVLFVVVSHFSFEMSEQLSWMIHMSVMLEFNTKLKMFPFPFASRAEVFRDKFEK